MVSNKYRSEYFYSYISIRLHIDMVSQKSTKHLLPPSELNLSLLHNYPNNLQIIKFLFSLRVKVVIFNSPIPMWANKIKLKPTPLKANKEFIEPFHAAYGYGMSMNPKTKFL